MRREGQFEKYLIGTNKKHGWLFTWGLKKRLK